MKVAPAVTFEVDQVFEQAAHVEQLLREIHPAAAKPEAAAEPDADVEGSDAEDRSPTSRTTRSERWSPTPF